MPGQDVACAGAQYLLDEVLGDFPFVDEPSKTHVLCLLLTAIMRPMIEGPVPLALIDAPQAGTGKSLLADVISVIALGRPAAMMSAPTSDAEWEKRIAAKLMEGAAVIVIDNLDYPLGAPSLAAVLTARKFTSRILGLSRMVTLPVQVTWVGTGNNIRVRGDLARRCYWIQLDPKQHRPWQRTAFKHPNLVEWIQTNRGALLGVLLTMARAWFLAGRPAPTTKSLGSFESWARTVGGVLEYTGLKGFLGNAGKMYEYADEEEAQWAGFLQAWLRQFQNRPVTASDITRWVDQMPNRQEVLPGHLADAYAVGQNFTHRLGNALAKRENKWFSEKGLRVHRTGVQGNAVQWQVIQEMQMPARVPVPAVARVQH